MDNPELRPFAGLIKAARERKGLTQRELGARVGLPQSHLSKIESAQVDLQVSNLIEIARALDLELALLPRSALPAIQALQGWLPASTPSIDAARDRDLRLRPLPAYRLDESAEDNG